MKQVFIVFGPQGSGKSTQVTRLAEKHDLAVFEAGAELRERAKVDENIHQIQKAGTLVPGAILRQLVEDFVHELPAEKGIVFDGYPRNNDQCHDFVELVEHYSWQVTVVYIHLSDKSALERLSTRFQMVDGRKIYREDDKPEIVASRLETFKTQTLPIKDWLADHYRLLEIDGEPPVDEVTALINSSIHDGMKSRGNVAVVAVPPTMEPVVDA